MIEKIHYSIFHETLTLNSSQNRNNVLSAVCSLLSGLCRTRNSSRFLLLLLSILFLETGCVQTPPNNKRYFSEANATFQTHARFLGNEFIKESRRLRKISLNESQTSFLLSWQTSFVANHKICRLFFRRLIFLWKQEINRETGFVWQWEKC